MRTLEQWYRKPSGFTTGESVEEFVPSSRSGDVVPRSRPAKRIDHLQQPTGHIAAHKRPSLPPGHRISWNAGSMNTGHSRSTSPSAAGGHGATSKQKRTRLGRFLTSVYADEQEES